MIHEDRRRAGSFGDDAQQYDRARPSYPPALVDHLLAGGARSVLDVGCGTGKVAALFAQRGCAVVGIEPDPRMAEVARAKGLNVEEANFESWDRAGRTFDLVVCGQAWHWVNSEIGPVRAAEALGSDGVVGLFWNQGRPQADLGEAMEAVYRRLAPDLEKYSILLHEVASERLEVAGAGLRSTGAFAEPTIATFPWSRTYSREGWIEHLLTHSDHRTMPIEARHELMEELGRVIDAHGGMVDVSYRCWLVTAQKQA